MPAPEFRLRSKGNLYAAPGYFRTDSATGVTRTPDGTRVCALPADFLRGLWDALSETCGRSNRHVLKACGRRFGERFARRFARQLAAAYSCPLENLHPAVVTTSLADAFAYHGWGRLVLDPPAQSAALTQVSLFDPVLPEVLPDPDGPGDALMVGLLAAVLGHLAGAERDCIQTECPSSGAGAARFLVAAPDRIAAARRAIEACLTAEARHATALAAAQAATPAGPAPKPGRHTEVDDE